MLSFKNYYFNLIFAAFVLWVFYWVFIPGDATVGLLLVINGGQMEER